MSQDVNINSSEKSILIRILEGILGSTAGGGTWGSITGTITQQLDLVAYVAAQILAAIGTVAIPKPAVNATANPNYPASTVNDFFFISGAGKIGGASGVSVEVGDMVYCIMTNAGGTQAAVGANFSILQTNIPGLTTVGLSLATLTNPSAIRLLRVNADNTVTAITSAELLEMLPIVIQGAASDETTAITADASVPKLTYRVVGAKTITGIRASLTTAQASGNIFTVDVKKNGTTILSTLLTIDNTSETSVGAATPAVISVTSLADDDEITIFVTQIGNGTAKGLKVSIF